MIESQQKAFACKCVAIICTIYESGVQAVGGGGNDTLEPKNESPNMIISPSFSFRKN